MLVESMTHAEVYRELERDRDTATTWWRHHLDTLRRPVLKARQLPLIHWADYTSPARRIRYLFFTRIFDKRMRRLLTGVAVPHSTSSPTARRTSGHGSGTGDGHGGDKGQTHLTASKPPPPSYLI